MPVFEPLFMQLALAASVATGVSLGLLGVYLVIRRVVFLGLVVANAATLGAAVAQALAWPSELLSLAAAVAAAAAFGSTDSGSRLSAESLMGWAYAATASATVLLLSWVIGGSSDTLHLLFGNVLSVHGAAVVQLSLVAVAAVSAQLVVGRRFLLITFDPEFAAVAGVNRRAWSLALNLAVGVAASTAVDAIGALTTFALLTLPALAALLVAPSIRATFTFAALLGAAVASAGLAVAFQLDLPAGPASVALLAAAVPIAALAKRVVDPS
jgi:ABC-type Mn2+/Zn2+ transport system permease subunit